jgi:hypothetical protein
MHFDPSQNFCAYLISLYKICVHKATFLYREGVSKESTIEFQDQECTRQNQNQRPMKFRQIKYP